MCTYQLFADVDANGAYVSSELLNGGSKALERSLRTSLLQAKFAGCNDLKTVNSADITFAAYSGSAQLKDAASCPYGASRSYERVTFDPSAGGVTVRLTIYSGSGGIQEK